MGTIFDADMLSLFLSQPAFLVVTSPQVGSGEAPSQCPRLPQDIFSPLLLLYFITMVMDFRHFSSHIQYTYPLVLLYRNKSWSRFLPLPCYLQRFSKIKHLLHTQAASLFIIEKGTAFIKMAYMPQKLLSSF